MRAELHGVGGDGEVAVGVNARERLIDEVDGDALRRGKRQRRRIELRMEAADRQHEIGVVAVGKQHAHRAGDRDEEDVRIEQRGEEVEALLVELEYAGEVDLQHENRDLVGRQAVRRMPRMAASPGGISMMTPSERLISVGSPQPIFAIGPMRKVPSCGGKMARRSLMMRGAFAMTSCGNMML